MAEQEWVYDFDKKGLPAASDLQLSVWHYLYVTRKLNTGIAPKITKETMRRQGRMDETTGLPWRLPQLETDTKKALDKYLGIAEQSKMRELGILSKTVS